MKRRLCSLLFLLLGAVLAAGQEASDRPDRIEIEGGAVLVGQIQVVEAGAIILQTDYAGLLTVQIDKIERLDLGQEREIGLPTDLLALYSEPDEKPEDVPQKAPQKGRPDRQPAKAAKPVALVEDLKSWDVESGLDLNGKSGNADRFDLKLSLEAEYKREFDRFNFYGRYAYGKNRGIQSANEIIGGAKYTNFIYDRTGIFVRAELEKDEFEGIAVRTTSAAGFTYQFRDKQDLRIEVRSGLSHRYENYLDDGEENFPGMDLGLDITWKFVEWARFKGTYTLVPSVDDFNQFIFEQDSGVNLPLDAGNFWKLRFGVTSQYNNQPDGQREKLDARYYARLIATWF